MRSIKSKSYFSLLFSDIIHFLTFKPTGISLCRSKPPNLHVPNPLHRRRRLLVPSFGKDQEVIRLLPNKTTYNSAALDPQYCCFCCNCFKTQWKETKPLEKTSDRERPARDYFMDRASIFNNVRDAACLVFRFIHPIHVSFRTLRSSPISYKTVGSKARELSSTARPCWSHLLSILVLSSHQSIIYSTAHRPHLWGKHQVPYLDRSHSHDSIYCTWSLLYHLLGRYPSNLTGQKPISIYRNSLWMVVEL